MMTDADEGEGDDTNHGEEEDEDDKPTTLAYWLMKSEPESRIEKGVDVKFSIEDLENADGAVVWDGIVLFMLFLFLLILSCLCI